MVTKFVAGILPAKNFLYHVGRGKPSYILLSYFYIQGAYEFSIGMIKKFRDMGIGIMADSGAFQAYKKGRNVDLNDYIEFIYDHKELIDLVIALDDMRDVKKTINNLDIMKYNGVGNIAQLIPVYHYGTPSNVFKQYADEFDVVAVGKIAYANEAVRRRTLYPLFSAYRDTKIHGLGVTHIDLIKEFPFYSVDSASWALWAAYGLLLTDIGPIRCTSGTSELSDTHFLELSRRSLYKIAAQAERYNISFAKLPFSNKARMAFNMHAFTEQIEHEYERSTLMRRMGL